MGFPQEIHLTPEEEAALDEAVAEAVAQAQAKGRQSEQQPTDDEGEEE